MRVRFVLLAATLGLLSTSPLGAQRGEIALLGGIVQSPDEEFDRVSSSQFAPPVYTRQRGSREPGPAFGAAATFAIRGHMFAELGFLHHGVERSISFSGVGDPTGPFLVTNTYEGSITWLWLGPSYRVVDRERFALSAMVAPTLFIMRGDAFSEEEVAFNAPTRSADIGFLLGLRARVWATEKIGVQVSVENAIWTLPIMPHPSDGSPIHPETSRQTPRQHDLRFQLGAALRLF